jgi:hypothetical protein
LRWSAFEERLSVERLRTYLMVLPDFDDVLAEERAMVSRITHSDGLLIAEFNVLPSSASQLL